MVVCVRVTLEKNILCFVHIMLCVEYRLAVC